MMNRLETYFDANYTYYTTNRRILKSLGLFENLAFVIMSTRENIRLIARAFFQDGYALVFPNPVLYACQNRCSNL